MTNAWMKWMGAAVAAAALAVAGCGDDHGEHDADEELCTHLKGGESRAVTATAEDTGAPEIGSDHTRYEISLPEANGQRAGRVTFVVDHGGEFIFGLSRDVPMQLLPAAGGETPATTKASSEACSELAVKHTVDLTVGTYVVRFGPTSEQTVNVVVEHESHE